MEVLADGRHHRRQELLDCLDDPEKTRLTLKPYLYRLRQKLRVQGYDIACEFRNRGFWFRLVGLVNQHDE
jgi:hypothetical protein